MSIVGAFMVPHPPIILPQVGRGEESKIQKTIDAYDEVAKKIASLEPDTIIISSPHSTMYADYFRISPNRAAVGDMSRFNAPMVSFYEEYDTQLVDMICKMASKRQEFPAGTMGSVDDGLDHGTMIPLYFIKKYYSSFKLVRIGLSGLSLPMHYEMGMIIKDALEQVDRKAVFVASGDLSHKMKADGPYGFAVEGPEYDERVMKVCASAAFDKLLEFDEGFCNRAAECGHRSFVIMAGALDKTKVDAHYLSHEATFGVGYGICVFDVLGNDDSRCFLDIYRKGKNFMREYKTDYKDAYVRLAKYTIDNYISLGKKITTADLVGEMWKDMPSQMINEKAATFVSIHKGGALRGCIGTILPTCVNIASEIIQNAISAATHDPRFEAIKEDELKELIISVDVLTKPEPVNSWQELDVEKYGVIVSCGLKRGLLLPDLDGVNSVSEQIAIACSKAGIKSDEDYTLERFEVIRHYQG